MHKSTLSLVSVLAAASLVTTCKPAPSEAGASAAATASASASSAAANSVRPIEAGASAELGKPAPDFVLPNEAGEPVRLSSFRGKTVVLEWFNPGCPFVKYAYTEGPLRELPKRARGNGVVWLAINSGAPGKQGHGVELNRQAKQRWGMVQPILFDESGAVGKAYGATTTPHIYIIDGAGVLRYQGALDNAPLGDAEGEPVNYVEVALAELAAGSSLSRTSTAPYGCTVKYAD